MNDQDCQISTNQAHHSNEALIYVRVAIDNLISIEQILKEQSSCVSVVGRLSSVLSTLKSCRNKVVQDHLSSCLRPSLEKNNEVAFKEVIQLFQQFIKDSSHGSHH